jgi:hypothetical protein
VRRLRLEQLPDDRFARIREALVALRLAPADDRQLQARRPLRVMEVAGEQRARERGFGLSAAGAPYFVPPSSRDRDW